MDIIVLFAADIIHDIGQKYSFEKNDFLGEKINLYHLPNSHPHIPVFKYILVPIKIIFRLYL